MAPGGGLPGDPAASAATALPFTPYVGRDEDYSTDAPGLGAMRLSFNTVTVVVIWMLAG